MIRLCLLACLLTSSAAGSIITFVTIDQTTALLNSTLFTTGTTYYAAWSLTGGDASNSQAVVSGLMIPGGVIVPLDATEFVFGNFTLGPNPAATAGIFQPSGTLNLQVTSLDSYSAFTQRFTAGTSLQFMVVTSGTFNGGIPDNFVFQLYDRTLSTLLYEQTIAIRDTTSSSVPEPSTFFATLGLLALGAKLATQPRSLIAPATLNNVGDLAHRTSRRQ